jgi:hypothetical protein
MATNFNLDLGSPATAEQLAATVVRLAVARAVAPEGTTATELLGDGIVTRNHLRCRAGRQKPSSSPWPRPIEESFGVVGACWLVFTLDPGRGSVTVQQDEVVWLTSAVLAHLPGDAVLHWESELAWLVRKDGETVVNDREDIWTPERLAMLPGSYRRSRLRFAGVPER